MALTFIDLCNTTLRRLNEVEISEAGFSTTRGVQSLVKDAVKNSINNINQKHFEWPFNAAQETATLTVGATEYSFPSTFKTIDWSSFQIIPDGTYETTNSRLRYIDRDEWYAKYRDSDDDAASTGISKPEYVFNAHGFGFGVSPAPDATYRIQFRYFLNETTLDAYNDTTTIPDVFKYVIVDGAIYHLYMFRDNTEQAQVAYQVFEQGIGRMRTLYINHQDYIRDTRVKF